jgi:SAM-dependent methyltransferase
MNQQNTLLKPAVPASEVASATPGSETGKRFGFGRNWQRFLRLLTPERIRLAEESLRDMLGVENLQGKSFLDIGSGSGLFSLAAMRLGAARVHSFDYDPLSVACTEELKHRYFAGAASWTVAPGDVLDGKYVNGLGHFDVVYSWGVLHSTGRMWQALENAVLPVARGGILFISIYNDQRWLSRYWKVVKILYNSNVLLRLALILAYSPYFIGVRFIVRALTGRLKLERGMSLWYDMKDWLGGLPFEVAKPEAILEFYRRRGFNLVKLRTCGGRNGCNEFVFMREHVPQ